MPAGSAPGEHRGGRGKGKLNKRSIPKMESAIKGLRLVKDYKVTPLQVLLGVGSADPGYLWVTDRHLSAMMAAAPYCHARLAAVALLPQPDDVANRRRDMLKQLTYQQRKQIEGILAVGDAEEIEGVAEAIEAVEGGK